MDTQLRQQLKLPIISQVDYTTLLLLYKILTITEPNYLHNSFIPKPTDCHFQPVILPLLNKTITSILICILIHIC